MKLQALREEIDRIDEDILERLNRRLSLAHQTRGLKSGIYDPERERRVLDRLELLLANFEFLRADFIAAVYGEILRESRRIQQEEGS